MEYTEINKIIKKMKRKEKNEEMKIGVRENNRSLKCCRPRVRRFEMTKMKLMNE